jgi:cellulose synthase/poly-beta-1,6-N-acetylglucosamine synthase-like glycosyltransferase
MTTEEIKPERPDSDGWTPGVLTGTIVSGASIAIGLYVLPVWLIALCVGMVVIAGGVLLASQRWSDAFDRLFAFSLDLPGWVVLSPIVCVALTLTVAQFVSLPPRALASAVLLGASISVSLTAFSQDSDSNLIQRFRAPIWVLVIAATVVGTACAILVWSDSILTVTFFLALTVFFAYVGGIIPLATFHKSSQKKNKKAHSPYPQLSVLIPAYNEEGYVGRCIDAVIASDYPKEKFEIVVIDDGSEDGTYDEAKQRESVPNVSVHQKSNGGKHDALNYGLSHSSGDLVVVIDADSFIEKDALSLVAGAFQSNPEVGAIAGNVKVLNRESSITKLQTLEYILGINTFRRAFDFFGAIPVVPGCLGGFRREALEKVGGYEGDTLTEDFDVTLQILKEGWTVRQTSGTVWTEAPFSWKDLYRQRLRWNRGNLDVMFKHADVFANDDSKYVHRLVFPFRLVSMFLAPIASVAVIAAIALGLASGAYVTVVTMLGYFLVVGLILTALVLLMEGESLRLVPYAIPMAVVYRYFQSFSIGAAWLSFFKDSDQGWGSVRREAQVEKSKET